MILIATESLGADFIISITDKFLGFFIKDSNVLYSHAFTLFLSIITIDLVLAFILNIGNVDQFKLLVRKILKYGIICYVISDYRNLTKTVLDGFIWVGKTAGVLSQTPTAELPQQLSGTENSIILKQYPDLLRITKHGEQIINNIANPPEDEGAFGIISDVWDVAKGVVSGTINILKDPLYLLKLLVRAIVLAIVGLITGFSFFMLTLNFCVTYIEFNMVAILSLIFIPFGANKYTSFLAERAASAIISFGIKLMVLSFILGATSKVMDRTLSFSNLDFSESIYLCFVSILLCYICWHAPKVITGFMTGQSMFSGHDAIEAGKKVAKTAAMVAAAVVTGGAAAAAGGAMAAGGAAGGATAGGAGATGAAAGAGGAASTGSAATAAGSGNALAGTGSASGSLTGGTGGQLSLPPGGGTGQLSLPPGGSTGGQPTTQGGQGSLSPSQGMNNRIGNNDIDNLRRRLGNSMERATDSSNGSGERSEYDKQNVIEGVEYEIIDVDEGGSGSETDSSSESNSREYESDNESGAKTNNMKRRLKKPTKNEKPMRYTDPSGSMRVRAGGPERLSNDDFI
ncbi:MAG TPA: type IV secretion system protein [Bacillota bacterium]|jgi:P-type conjugative transfer protein TrbL|nr:type IV secretion system protein [Bacillota bacterium]HPO98137.1 type IV secretion system protein [Bacillota bacterium]